MQPGLRPQAYYARLRRQECRTGLIFYFIQRRLESVSAAMAEVELKALPFPAQDSLLDSSASGPLSLGEITSGPTQPLGHTDIVPYSPTSEGQLLTDPGSGRSTETHGPTACFRSGLWAASPQ